MGQKERKITIKYLKMVQMTQNLDKKCHFMAKNASNYPKFLLEVYLDSFYWFPKFCKFSTIFGRFLAQKPIFFRWRGKNFGKKISTENRTSSWKMVQLVHKLVEMYPRVQATKLWIKFLISGFFLILRLPKCAKRVILG